MRGKNSAVRRRTPPREMLELGFSMQVFYQVGIRNGFGKAGALPMKRMGGTCPKDKKGQSNNLLHSTTEVL